MMWIMKGKQPVCIACRKAHRGKCPVPAYRKTRRYREVMEIITSVRARMQRGERIS